MTSAIDPHRRFQHQVALQAGACWILALLAAVWMWRMPVPADSSKATAAAATAVIDPVATSAIDPAIWNITLWRPFSDEAMPTAAPSAPTPLKLFSILQQGDGLTAAIAPGENAGLVYVKAGDTCSGFTVLRVEADGVVLRKNGQELRLGLGP